MQILSDFKKDIRHPKPEPGSYEWWYFDAISSDGQYSIVVIFYDGNPFSRRYNDAILNQENDLAEQYPAISLSVYSNQKPIFYSFEEVRSEEAEFSTITPEGRVKNNRFMALAEDKQLTYRLVLDQVLPNGDSLNGSLTFSSERREMTLENKPNDGEESHSWNLVQPSARVTGRLQLRGFTSREIHFRGTGYHDHNIGLEPMHESFMEWYWGRVHFSGKTLVYYLMSEHLNHQSKAWVIDENGDFIQVHDGIKRLDPGRNVFGLRSARKIEYKGNDLEFLIQMSSVIDDGPFYQRFSSNMMLTTGGEIFQGKGISEYIYPSRIKARLFRPLVNMRINYPGKDHWVQKKPRLYRWTW
ncbi:MAG: hypothetical protein GVY08_14865 [Bacteroidetes bacterium]|jgi:carotenoid 1,2-hydratase|nr:hypothetical protein [Bacteroidota bacterium]